MKRLRGIRESLPAAKHRKIDHFRLLELPTDILLYCLTFTVEFYTEVLAVSRVCRAWQQVICNNICDFRHVRVQLLNDNATAIAGVYPFWENFIINGSLSAPIVRVFQSSLRSAFLSSACSSTLMELAQAPKLRQLTINSAGHCSIGSLRTALPFLQQLETLSIQYTTICQCLASALPSSLLHLSARRISSTAVHSLPVLYCLKRLRLTAVCHDPYTLSQKCPVLRRYYIQQYSNTTTVDPFLDFAPFRQLVDLQFSTHGRFTVPGSLMTLATFQSNSLLGPLPTGLRELTLLQKKGLPVLTEQLNRLCSLPSLLYLSLSDVQPSTLQQLSMLPRFESLELKHQENPLNLLQYPLRHLRSFTITECDDALVFFQLTAMDALADLTIIESRVSQVVVYNLLKALPMIKELSLWGCSNVEPDSLRAHFPAVMIDYLT